MRIAVLMHRVPTTHPIRNQVGQCPDSNWSFFVACFLGKRLCSLRIISEDGQKHVLRGGSKIGSQQA